jgi:hypothetical protein
MQLSRSPLGGSSDVVPFLGVAMRLILLFSFVVALSYTTQSQNDSIAGSQWVISEDSDCELDAGCLTLRTDGTYLDSSFTQYNNGNGTYSVIHDTLVLQQRNYDFFDDSLKVRRRIDLKAQWRFVVHDTYLTPIYWAIFKNGRFEQVEISKEGDCNHYRVGYLR